MVVYSANRTLVVSPDPVLVRSLRCEAD